MCGFIGCVHDQPKAIDEQWKQTFAEMNNMITHRGPDDDGYFF